MSTFKTNKLLYGNPVLIGRISQEISKHFSNEEYEVSEQTLVSGGREISITKGGLFKAVLGMKTALKISLIPEDSKIRFNAGVGLFGLQAIPAAIALLVWWPVLITQIWGLIQQSKLDDQALEIAERIIFEDNQNNYDSNATIFCPVDGARIPADAKMCPYCGTPI